MPYAYGREQQNKDPVARINSPGEVEHHDGLEDLPAVLLVQRDELLKQRGRDSRRQLRLGHGELREPGDLLGAVAEVLHHLRRVEARADEQELLGVAAAAGGVRRPAG